MLGRSLTPHPRGKILLLANHVDEQQEARNKQQLGLPATSDEQETRVTGFRTGSGQSGFSQKGHNSLHFVALWSKCALVTTFCNIFITFRINLQQFAMLCDILQTFCTHFPGKVDQGELRYFCDDPFVLTPSGSCQVAKPCALN